MKRHWCPCLSNQQKDLPSPFGGMFAGSYQSRNKSHNAYSWLGQWHLLGAFKVRLQVRSNLMVLLFGTSTKWSWNIQTSFWAPVSKINGKNEAGWSRNKLLGSKNIAVQMTKPKLFKVKSPRNPWTVDVIQQIKATWKGKMEDKIQRKGLKLTLLTDTRHNLLW